LADRLALELGKDSIFIDVDNIPLGSDFVKRLTNEVQSCDVLLAVIGPKWLDIRDNENAPRLDDPTDFVRVEITAALQRDIPVIPILLNGAKIPRADRLPSALRDLAVRNALDVRHASFHDDVGRLIRSLKQIPSQRGGNEINSKLEEKSAARPRAASLTNDQLPNNSITAAPIANPSQFLVGATLFVSLIVAAFAGTGFDQLLILAFSFYSPERRLVGLVVFLVVGIINLFGIYWWRSKPLVVVALLPWLLFSFFMVIFYLQLSSSR